MYMAHPNGFNVFNHLTPRRGQTYLAGSESLKVITLFMLNQRGEMKKTI